jgi:hypothetical protein
MKSRGMRCSVARTGDKTNACKVLWGIQKERNRFRDQGVGWRMELKYILKEVGIRMDGVSWIHPAQKMY